MHAAGGVEEREEVPSGSSQMLLVVRTHLPLQEVAERRVDETGEGNAHLPISVAVALPAIFKVVSEGPQGARGQQVKPPLAGLLFPPRTCGPLVIHS